ncbi:MAG: CHASE2 domain-containing protein [Caldiserica bacterium]|nr:CHASE2 domain-containing protein [Caldisericota bacterium]
MRRVVSRYFLSGIISGIFSVFLIVLLGKSGALNFFSGSYLDFLFELRGERKPANVVIVNIDEETLRILQETWPISRYYYAQLIQRLSSSGIKAVGVDVLFLNPAEKEADEKLGRTLINAPVVLAAKFERERRKIGGLETEKFFLATPQEVFPLARWGFINLPMDRDGSIRKVILKEQWENMEVPSFALSLYRIAGENFVPSNHPYLINFYGGSGTFPTFSFQSVLKGEINPGYCKNKFVLIGVGIPEAHDYFLTPFKTDSLMSGVEIQANILENISKREFLREVAPTNILIINIISACLAVASSLLLSTILGGASLAIFALLLFFFSVYFFTGKNYFWDVSPTLLAYLITYTFTSFTLKVRIFTSPMLGKYRLVEEIGRGGMAVVYRALRRGRRRFVALKVLQESFSHDPVFLKRFQREVEAVKALEHPNIVKVYEAGSEDDKYFFAMEFLRGKSLGDYLKEKERLDEPEAFSILTGIAKGLQHAHSKGIIHRDLKPGNVILTSQGPKIVDFGLARNLSSRATRVTATGTMMGTPEYMAPEQFRGEEADERTDIYALGVVFYEMLKGSPPFSGENLGEIMNLHLWEEADTSGLREEVKTIINKMLAKNKEERFQNVEELLKRLEEVRR